MKRKYNRSEPYRKSCFDKFLVQGGGELVQNLYQDKLNAASTEATETARCEMEKDDLMVKELNDLTIEERKQIYEEIHGVCEPVHTTPAFIEQRLDMMEREIQRIKQRSTYEKALFLSPRYVKNKAFRLIFLRCDNFDARAAAYRYVCFYEFKAFLFGPNKLVKDITQADLDEDDMKLLRRGYFQILPEKDRSGRMILMGYHHRLLFERWEHPARISFYILMQIFKTEAAQSHGVVGIAYDCFDGSRRATIPFQFVSAASLSSKFYCGMPLKIQAFHFCYNQITAAAPIMAHIKVALGKPGRIRFRIHYGSELECRYKLASFGIPVHALPDIVDGDEDEMDMSQYHHWLDEVQLREQLESIVADNNPPSNKDCVFGRGRIYQEHSGNRELRMFVDAHFDEYTQASRSEKVALFRRLVQELKGEGIRFLEKAKHPGLDDSEWIEVNEEKVREKISHAFRNKRIVDQYHHSIANSDTITNSNSNADEDEYPEATSNRNQHK